MVEKNIYFRFYRKYYMNMGLGKIQLFLEPHRNKYVGIFLFLATVLFWCMGLVNSIETRPSLKNKYLHFWLRYF